jgi:hypothetical protein
MRDSEIATPFKTPITRSLFHTLQAKNAEAFFERLTRLGAVAKVIRILSLEIKRAAHDHSIQAHCSFANRCVAGLLSFG